MSNGCLYAAVAYHLLNQLIFRPLHTSPTNFSFLQGGGEMGELIRNYDWQQTSLGSPAQWPQSLCTTLSIILHSKFPMFLFWGSELLCFYNDAYRPSLGNNGKHPNALGQPAETVWPEIWPVIKPLIDQVLGGGEATWSENQLIPIFRNGQMEEVYWTFSYSPVINESGSIGGVFITCTETSDAVINLQKLQNSQQHFQNLVRDATVGIIVLTGSEMQVEIVNQAYGMLIEKTPDELMHKPLFSIIPEMETIYWPILESVLYSNEPLFLYEQLYFVYVKGEKKEGYLNLVYQPYKDDAGNVIGVMVMCHDITKEVTARKKLEESEHYFRQLTDTVPAIIWLTDPSGYCTYLNKNWYTYTGQTSEEAEGFGWLSATHPDDAEETGHCFIDANTRQVPFNATYRLRSKSGEYRWAIDSGSPKFSAGGVYEGMVGTVVDVHEQRVAEEKIKQSEARFRDLIAAAPAGIGLFVGRNLIIETPNQAFIDIVGKGSNIAGKPLREVMPELEAEGQPFLQILDDVYTSGKMFQTFGTQVKILQNGVLTSNFYNFSYTPLLDAAGKTYAILDIAVDVTEQVTGRLKLEEAEERVRLSLEAADLGTYELDMTTNGMLTSPRLNEIFGITGSASREQYINMYHPEDLPMREAAHQQALKTGILDYTARITHNTGNTHWVRTMGKVYFSETGEPLRLLGVVQDITQQKELERQKDSFLSIASHELKTPVTSIKGYAQLMEKMFRRNGDAKSAEMVAKMNNQANRLNNLIADLLDVTKVNNGRLQFNLTTFDFNQMVEEVVEDMQRISTTHTIQIQLGFTGQITADRERLCQVMVNLLSNSIKYSPNAAIIIVSTENLGTEVQLCVQDFGIGISGDMKDRVFEQFYRVSGNREHTFPGLGLGLYISSEIIKRMNGRIWVNSVEGKGATFCFAIPLVQL